MKKIYFFISLVIILLLSISFIFYGAYLNQRGEIQISKRMEERAIPLNASVAQFRSIHPHIILDSINLYSNEMADAVALIDGRISEVLVSKNSQVVKGQPLFTVENESIALKIKEADSAILKAQATLRQADNDYQRYIRLRAQDATSASKYDAAEAQYNAALAALDQCIAQRDQLLVQNARQQVLSPVDGKVLVLYRQLGAYVQAGTSLALVGNFSHLFFSTPVNDEFASRFDLNYSAELSFDNSSFNKVFNTNYEAGNLGNAQTFDAHIINITPELSQPAAMRNVLWVVNNESGILEPQTYGGVSFKISQPHQCLSIPISSLIDSSHSAVFVINNNILERRQIKTGISDDNFIEVLSGLNEGDIVATGGMEGLGDGVKVSFSLDKVGD